MLCIIPKRRTLKVGENVKKTYHYELESISKFIVVYRCIENGAKECFQKKDFFKYNTLED